MSSCCPANSTTDCEPKVQDLTDRRWSQSIWLANYLALAAGWLLPSARPVLWSVGLAAAGILCVVNAARCARLHCHITGPVFLLGSLLSILNAARVISVSWNFLGLGVLAGVAIGYAPELIVGKYFRRERHAPGGNG